MIRAHGGKLVHRIAEGKERETLMEKVPNLPKLKLNEREIADIHRRPRHRPRFRTSLSGPRRECRPGIGQPARPILE